MKQIGAQLRSVRQKWASVIGLNPAIRDQVKTGHRERPRTS